MTLPQMPNANDVIGNAILDLGARAVSAVPFVPPVAGERGVLGGGEKGNHGGTEVTGNHRDPWRAPLQVMGQQIMVESPLIGRHQLRNIALAIATAEELHNQGFAQITARTIERGIRETLAGTLQVIPATDGAPEVVLDVAHNPAGVGCFHVVAAYEDRPITMVFG